MRPALLPLYAAILAGIAASGCARDLTGAEPPTDRPHFPVGIAVHPESNVLAVVSSNFDLEFNRGAILLADLDRVDAAIADASDEELPVIEDAYVSAAFIPSFGNRPIFSATGEHLLLATRGQNRVSDIDVTLDPPTLDCGDAAEVPTCGESPRAFQVPGNDPFELAIVDENEDRVRGVTTLLASNQVFFFDLTPSRSDSGRLRLVTPTVLLGDWLPENDEVTGVRGMTLRPASGEVPAHIFATVEHADVTSGIVETDLVWFEAVPEPRRFEFLNLETLTLANSARAVAPTPSGDLLVLLRGPDALARVELTPNGNRLSAAVTGSVSTCAEPTSLTVTRVPTADGDVERAFVTCFENNAVLVYDPVTLSETDAIRFFGQGPYDVTVDLEHDPPRAYVSHFLDDTIGVFDLTDADGAARVVPRARIGTPRPGFAN
jgi:hypothetical protein